MTQWGIVSTIKAAPREVLRFVAHHLDLGATQCFIYLDAPDPALAHRLNAHPNVTAFETDDAWWEARNGRPETHQMRQQRNGTHAYRKANGLDWLAHIDVDEFLIAAHPIDRILSAVPPEITTARVPPIEALVLASGAVPRHFKAFHLDHKKRQRSVERLYPTFGAHLPGGFVSHIAGKAFIRTGLEGIKIRIHGIKRGDRLNPNDLRLNDIELAHIHAQDWENWRAHFTYRHAFGSYRKDLPGGTGINRHTLFATILETEGEDGLRRFFEEVMRDTPEHVDALAREGLLRRYDLNLDAKVARHFPTP